jgi:hypothetical protein
MKRAGLFLALACVLGAASQALGTTRAFEGKVTGQAGSEITFDVIRHGGVDRWVKNFAYEVTEKCEVGGTVNLTGAAPEKMSIADDHSFKASFQGQTDHLKVSGHVYGGNANGRISTRFTPFAPPVEDCRARHRHWTAKH